MKNKENIWKSISIGTVITLLVLLGDNIRLRTTIMNKLDTLIEHDEKQEQRWENQILINGQWITLYDYFIPPVGAGAEEETEGD